MERRASVAFGKIEKQKNTPLFWKLVGVLGLAWTVAELIKLPIWDKAGEILQNVAQTSDLIK